ncbi:type II secretion system protein GspK [Pseudomonas moorei]|uniref:general secretion pathway protein GspK n=1 Tax=Pseudomonas moorei TaxID=395599 RepID=UPI0036F3E0FF
MRAKQRGVALISVLLVMSLALLIIGGVLRSHRLLLQSSAQQLQQMHLKQLALANETWTLLRLQDAGQTSETTVDLTQDWATVRGYEIEDTHVRVAVEDLAGRFNVNALLIQGQIDQVTLNRWHRLLEMLELPALPLEQVGALREVSQLRLLPGIDGERLRRLEPWIATLPKEAALNINTAPEIVLRSIDGLDAATVTALLRQRSTTPWPSVQAFTQDPMLEGLGLSSHGLGIDSRWYRITVQVTQGQSRLRLATDVERDPKTRQLKILQRRVLPSNTHEIIP